MTDHPARPVAVEQVDREASPALIRRGRLSLKEMVAADMEEGRADDSDVVQAFARHRLSSPDREGVEKAREAGPWGKFMEDMSPRERLLRFAEHLEQAGDWGSREGGFYFNGPDYASYLRDAARALPLATHGGEAGAQAGEGDEPSPTPGNDQYRYLIDYIREAREDGHSIYISLDADGAWHVGQEERIKRQRVEAERDAARWRALWSSARIRMMGCAGFDFADDGTVTPRAAGQHLGVEVWDTHPAQGDREDSRGRRVLLAYVDARADAATVESPTPRANPTAADDGRAREVLAVEHDRQGLSEQAQRIRLNDLTPSERRAVAAIQSTLATSPRAGDLREAGQAEGFAAAVAQLRDMAARKPPATLHHAATILADQLEQSCIPTSALRTDDAPTAGGEVDRG